jgi:hypothetical protein
MNTKVNKKLQLKKIMLQTLDREEQKNVNGGSLLTVTPVFCKP